MKRIWIFTMLICLAVFFCGGAECKEYVVFGHYEQDVCMENGKEPVEWIVLEEKDDSVLLISRYALETKPFHEEWTDVSWEECSLRAWLNDTFFRDAFSAEEQARILTVNGDNVFLLSVDEAEQYFSADRDRIVIATEAAIRNGAFVVDEINTYVFGTEEQPLPLNACWWWLRSNGETPDSAARVDADGYVFTFGQRVSEEECCVRPCICVKLMEGVR